MNPNLLALSPIIELDEREIAQLMENSIERVFNTAIKVGLAAEKSKNDHISELGSVSWQDCEELKPLVDKLWRAVQNAQRKGVV